ncbi:uncharacterized protein DMENIID0001_055560 [Sergentomyia squamirostris]
MAKFNPRFLFLTIVFIAIVLTTYTDVVGAKCIRANRGVNAPKVSAHRHEVNTGEGYDAELFCNYKSDPVGRSTWLRDGTPLVEGSKYRMTEETHGHHNRTGLVVRKVHKSDLGSYQCQVDNSVPLSDILLYYQKSVDKQWTSEKPLVAEKHKEHSGVWLIQHRVQLSPGTWHARVKSRNTEGWSKYSEMQIINVPISEYITSNFTLTHLCP